jgi:predicted anti-sigma-YlaC factor YlaD
MKCNKIEEMIHDFIDQKLSNNNIVLMNKHISECDECKKIYDEMIQYKEIFKGLNKYAVTEQFLELLNTKIDQLPKKSYHYKQKIG